MTHLKMSLQPFTLGSMGSIGTSSSADFILSFFSSTSAACSTASTWDSIHVSCVFLKLAVKATDVFACWLSAVLPANLRWHSIASFLAMAVPRTGVAMGSAGPNWSRPCVSRCTFTFKLAPPVSSGLDPKAETTALHTANATIPGSHQP